ncbi:hypothetical protein LOZ39_006187 [Ophidiomyces ophidiicola]|nr:hypothetical protein LOZ64_006635 [Ophidiomyces ophidiicola]KAI1907368.1 hypothetical protein LOZ61_006171 [Ophidiomyces ophidiicola]KAI1950166.1 hypothetical protein LOZ59_005895 [Ophidiomyces ophidiicola]KAI1967179.1 hypothetical protein LOZ56_005638 [Ophidiomyces ophidiicola]KAI1998807.1 hypothetical protein LOZ50_006831 [Ophidiomyces ophidiicola]
MSMHADTEEIILSPSNSSSQTTEVSDEIDNADINMNSSMNDFMDFNSEYSSVKSDITDSGNSEYSSNKSSITDSDNKVSSSEVKKSESANTEDERDSSSLNSDYNTDVNCSVIADYDFIDNITDNKYDARSEMTDAMIWQHITFHIIHNSISGWWNILLAKIMLLHTK